MGAFYYCEKADEKGGMLKKELEALDARHDDKIDQDHSEVYDNGVKVEE